MITSFSTISDHFLGVISSDPAFVGNRSKETDEEMRGAHLLVGLLGQLDVNAEQIVRSGRIAKTQDGIFVGIILANGKVLIGK